MTFMQLITFPGIDNTAQTLKMIERQKKHSKETVQRIKTNAALMSSEYNRKVTNPNNTMTKQTISQTK